jgi:protein-S-isoprenylcysteine O-methyltransferase Ste14
MIVPTLPNAILLFLLGAAFLHYMVAGGRTFYSPNMALESGGVIGEASFGITGAAFTWWVGLHQPMGSAGGVVAAVLLAGALTLYEWTRHTIRSRRFGVGWGNHVPEEVCDVGPYRWVRHPIYLSYLLTFGAVAIALPHWMTLASLAGNSLLFLHAMRNDEKNIADSPIAAAYAAYRQRTGMFFPRFSRAAPGR